MPARTPGHLEFGRLDKNIMFQIGLLVRRLFLFSFSQLQLLVDSIKLRKLSSLALRVVESTVV